MILSNFIFSAMTWLSLVSSIFFIIFFALGLGPIAFVAVSEVIPLSCREFGSGMASFANGLSSVMIIKSFKNLVVRKRIYINIICKKKRFARFFRV